ncbi:MAG TPA: cyclic nucleotide-binding domain-containing protein, partial [Marmoricola sp.]|nr:cyclic nucleotide-binding domain-containing protein [Marmoricola sp.]
DYLQVEGVLRLLRELAAPGRIVVVATHDDRVSNLADTVVDLAPAAAREDARPSPHALAAGEVLFRQGDPGDLVYVVESGAVEVYHELFGGGEELIDVMGPGRYFGELAPLLRLPRSASVRAMEDSVVIGYSLHAFRQAYPGIAERAHLGPAGPAAAEG